MRSSVVRATARVIALALVVVHARGDDRITAAPQAPTSTEVERLAALGRLWTVVRYAHPYLSYKDIDWDAALLAAIPKVRMAGSTREFADAVSGMLAALNDPATRLRDAPPAVAPGSTTPSSAASASFIDRAEDVVTIRLTDHQALADYARVLGALQEHTPMLRDAGAVVVDLRERTPGPAAYVLRAFMQSAAPLLTAETAVPPATRTVFHSGYAPQMGTTSGGYYSALQTTLPAAIVPAPGVRPKRVAFVTDGRTPVPEVALALQRSGSGIIVAETALDDSSVVTPMPVPLGEGVVALVRTTEIVGDRPDPVAADVVIGPSASSSGDGDAAMHAALAFARGGTRPRREAASAAPASAATPVWRPDRVYDETPFPSVEHRLLGVYRLWGVVNYFFPYKHLMTRDWNKALTEFIPTVIAATDASEYGLAIAQMATWLEDSHVNVGSSALQPLYGVAPTPLRLRYVEGVPVVVGFTDESAARAAGVEIGDVVTRIDGQAATVRAQHLARYLTASNEWSLRSKQAAYLLNGPEGSQVALTLTGGGGRTKEATLTRAARYRSSGPAAADQPVHRILDGNIGYVDLTRLEGRDVDRTIDELLGTRAIIFDMRGYPRGVFMTLAPRLNKKQARYAATFLRPVVSSGYATTSFTFQQEIPYTTKPGYQGRTVMLIDERAISQSEHTGLFLEQASDVTFIGSPTAGANGDVTRLVLPGRVMVGFTGHDVRHADGRQLQKVGLQPHVTVHPTIQGIREGRDELLERALRFVNQGK